MKIAFTTSGETLDAPMEPRFARAPGFIIYDTETETFVVFDNRQALDTAHGAGMLVTKAMLDRGVGSVVTGHCGPNAFRALQAAGIRVFTTQSPTVAEALDAYRAETLSLLGAADVEGHWA